LARLDSRDGWVIGLDDTDMPDRGGTGQLARRLADEIGERDLGAPVGVTRHQLFEGPGVPKTSRNSAAAIEFIGAESGERLFAAVIGIVGAEAIDGSDPGVALAPAKPNPAATAFAIAAQAGLVTQDEARRVAAESGIALAGLGGDEGGVIGALAAVGLRIDGNDGRYVGLAGIREVSGVVQVAKILERTGVVAVVDESGESLGADVDVDLGDWVRPRLVDGRPVLVASHDGGRWSNADARSK
jgi:hypothetical protein